MHALRAAIGAAPAEATLTCAKLLNIAGILEVEGARAAHGARNGGGGMRVLDYALATDGGTQVLTLELDGGAVLSFGLDGRMESPGAGKQLFIGRSPESPEARLLPVGGAEEAELVALLEAWLDRTQGFLRREALAEADLSALEGQDMLDRLALDFLLEVKSRRLA